MTCGDPVWLELAKWTALIWIGMTLVAVTVWAIIALSRKAGGRNDYYPIDGWQWFINARPEPPRGPARDKTS